MIQPRTLAGFRDFLPAVAIPRERLMEKTREVYRSYGFVPIDTPALEYTEILLGKGGEETDKQLYRFTDNGGRDVGMRFDLTVPFARFTAQHLNEIGLPFKRYHLGTVWRGESAQRGRYREFVQCDFDTIGTTSNAADIEVAMVIHDLFVKLGVDRFQIHINNRMILNGLLSELGLSNQTGPILRSLDKLAKIGREAVIGEMKEKAGVATEAAEKVLNLVTIEGENKEILNRLDQEFGSNPQAKEGITRLQELLSVITQSGIPSERIKMDVSIARGLDYYTGTVYETFLTDDPAIGSVCSGGRYDNLATLYTKQVLPGVGASLGLDRLLAALEKQQLLGTAATAAPVLIVQFDKTQLGHYQAAARQLRAAGIGVEVFPEAKKVGQQLGYADKRGFSYALIAGPDEIAKGIWQVKDLKNKQSTEKSNDELVDYVKSVLLSSPKS